MATDAAVVVGLTAVLLAALGALVRAGHTSLIAGHRKGREAGVDEAALGRWFGTRVLLLAAATAALAAAEYADYHADLAWVAWTVLVVAACLYLVVAGRRFLPGERGA